MKLNATFQSKILEGSCVESEVADKVATAFY